MRRSRPVDHMDVWLESVGFYRKHTARDGTCLYRAVAEQLFFTQVYHSDVRRCVVEFMLRNPTVFQPMVEEPIDIYAERMRSLKEYGGKVEIHAIAKLFRCDFIMYEEMGEPPQQYTAYGFGPKVTLCRSFNRHYDSVFTKDFINEAAFCQSLVYEMLYKNVFRLKEVDYAVSKMLRDKTAKHHREHLPFVDCFSIRYEMRDNFNNVRELLDVGITPFPYKVAKSLDVDLYRNVEYDTWNEYRKGLRYGFCTWTCRELQVGVKCKVNIDENTSYIGHIQEMAPKRGPVVVYIEKIGEKMTVPYKSLEMLPPPPLVLTPPRPSPDLNLKFATILSSIALRRSMAKEEPSRPKRPSKVHLPSRNRAREEPNLRRNEAEKRPKAVVAVSDSNALVRSDNSNEEASNADSYQTQSYNLREAIGLNESPSSIEKPDQQLYVPGVASAGKPLYVLSSQSDATTDPNVPGAPAYVPMAILPVQVNLMTPKSVRIDGSDLPFTDLATLRFCYNLGVDCLRMNCLAWNITAATSSVFSSPVMSGYVPLESRTLPTDNLALTDGTEESALQVPQPASCTEVADSEYGYILPHSVESLDDGECDIGTYEYDDLPLVQHPEVSSTTPTDASTLAGTYYYPVEGYEQHAVAGMPFPPWTECVYDIGTPEVSNEPAPFFVTQDGVVYQSYVPGHTQSAVFPQNPPAPI